jgi:hypothetical protein
VIITSTFWAPPGALLARHIDSVVTVSILQVKAQWLSNFIKNYH